MKTKLIFMAIDALCIAFTVSLGYTFHRSGAFASRLIPGFGHKSAEERARYNEEGMCREVAAALIFCAVAFIVGVILDSIRPGLGLAIGILLSVIRLALVRKHSANDFSYWLKK